MCGLVAFFAQGRPSDVDLVMAEAVMAGMRHRGTEEPELRMVQGGVLGHVRLPLLDVGPGGRQPFAHGTARLVFNGSILNWRALDRELGRGEFPPRSDTEVLARWLAAGRSVRVLDGPFAFVHVPPGADAPGAVAGVVARDRLGQRPLYRAETPRGVWYASEARALARALGLRPSLGWAACYLRTLEGEGTPWEGLEEVAAGTVETVTRVPGGLRTTVERFWRWAPNPDPGLADTATAATLVEAHLRESVDACLDADVEVGSFLSGGLDSGLISGFASPRPTFTVGWRAPGAGADGKDERAQAEALAADLTGEHVSVQVGEAAAWSAVQRALAALDHPRAGACWPNEVATRLAGSHVRVVLDGAGGDELFGGYPWRRAAYGRDLRGVPGFWLRGVPGDMLRDNRGIAEEHLHAAARDLLELGAPEGARAFDLLVFLPQLLTVSDRLGLHGGVEVRCPWLSNALVSLAAQIPARSLAGATGAGKAPLRHLAARRLGADVASRPKQGFTGPDRAWFGGPWRARILDRLRESEYLDAVVQPGTVERVLGLHQAGEMDGRHALWALLSVDAVWR